MSCKGRKPHSPCVKIPSLLRVQKWCFGKQMYISTQLYAFFLLVVQMSQPFFTPEQNLKNLSYWFCRIIIVHVLNLHKMNATRLKQATTKLSLQMEVCIMTKHFLIPHNCLFKVRIFVNCYLFVLFTEFDVCLKVIKSLLV